MEIILCSFTFSSKILSFELTYHSYISSCRAENMETIKAYKQGMANFGGLKVSV